MKRHQIFLLLAAAFSLGGWAKFRKPASPTDSMPLVIFQGFAVEGLEAEKGQKLADAAAAWPGVRATAFSAQSSILSVARLETLSETELLDGLRAAAGPSAAIEKKVFPASTRPECPVPLEWIAAAPTGLLGLGLAFLAFFGASFLMTQKSRLAAPSRPRTAMDFHLFI